MPVKKATKSGKTKKPSAAATAMTAQAARSAVIRAAVPQWFRIDPDQVQGNAGGFVWQINDKEQVIRYLIIGSEGGNYYQTPQQVSSQCASCVLRMTRTPDNFKWLIETIRQVSREGRAAKQESTLLALATAIVFAPTPGTKTDALNAVNDCVRILTHMYMLIGYIKIFSKAGHPTPTIPFSASAPAPPTKGGEATAVVVGSGFGRGIRRVFGEYFYSRTGIEIANLITKYQNREGWTIKDVLTLIHIDPKRMKDDDGRLAIDHVFKTKEEFAKLLTTAPPSPAANLFNAIKEIHALTERIAQPPINPSLASIPNYQSISDLNHIAHLITTAGLSREHLPSQLFKQRRIWEALLTNKGPSGKGKGMPLTALIRNLGKLSTQEIKIIEPRLCRDESPSGKLAYSLSTAPTMTPAFPPGHTQHYTEYIFHRLTNKHDIKYTKIHPYTILVAMMTYKKGAGDKGSLTWVPNVHILDALDHAFKLAFQNITPTGKRIKIALDVSGSMSAAFCTGSPIVNCATASIAMMMMTLYVERAGAPPNGASSALLTAPGASPPLATHGAVGGRPPLWKTTQLPDGRTLYENTKTNQCQFTKPEEEGVSVAPQVAGGGVAPNAANRAKLAPLGGATPLEAYRKTKQYLNLPLTAEEEQRRQRIQSGHYTPSPYGGNTAPLYLPELYPAPARKSNVTICAFSNTLTELTNAIVGYMDTTIDPITGLPGMSIADALKLVEMPFSSTDCALPIVRALEKREPVDAFVIYTDSETYMGKIHPQAALEEYRRTMGIDAKLIVVGMTSNCLTIADPKDLNTLNLAGFDTATPRLINDFIAGGSLCPPPPPPPTTTTTKPHQHHTNPNPDDEDDAGDEFVMLDAMS
jgi:60 kDa SS-A/Ro ribonucleoprotein